jgi:hypothetical protein
LLAIEVKRVATAERNFARDPGVERCNLTAIMPAPTPTTNGSESPLDDPTRVPRAM